MRAKRIFLNVLAESEEGAKDNLIYKDVLLQHLGKPKSEGYTIAQIQIRMRLLDSLKAADSNWELDHREYEMILGELEKERWIRPTKNIIKFIEDLRDAPDVISANVVEMPVSV